MSIFAQQMQLNAKVFNGNQPWVCWTRWKAPKLRQMLTATWQYHVAVLLFFGGGLAVRESQVVNCKLL